MSELISECGCKDIHTLLTDHSVFIKDNEGNWILTWIELVEDQGKYKKINKYGVYVNYCPICGNKLKK